MTLQTTPVHVKLWHKEFWFMATANLLLTMSVYMLIPIMPVWLVQTAGFSFIESGVAMGIFGIGLFLCGSFCSYLIQRFRRNVVCMWTILFMAGAIGLPYYIEILPTERLYFYIILASRLLSGAFFGLAQMILFSTLIIDTSESFQRTEAGFCTSWFSRFSISLGPMAAIGLYNRCGFETCVMASCACALFSVVLIKLVNFPFRAPEEGVRIFSIDRFFLPHSTPLFINVTATTIAIGLLISQFSGFTSYGILMLGFLPALITQSVTFRKAGFNVEIAGGLIIIGLAAVSMYSAVDMFLTPLLTGLGLGMTGSRFLLSFIQQCKHCQRGTSQSTFMLGWESGIVLGIAAGHILSAILPSACLPVVILSVVLLSAVVHYLISYPCNRNSR